MTGGVRLGYFSNMAENDLVEFNLLPEEMTLAREIRLKLLRGLSKPTDIGAASLAATAAMVSACTSIIESERRR